MYLVPCDNQPEETPDDFTEDLAEVIEMKLLGVEKIKGKNWHDYANDLLAKYRQSTGGPSVNYKPLWRTMYEQYCSLDKSFSPNVVFMQIIKAVRHRVESDFVTDEISKNVLVDYFDKEAEKAMRCE